MLILSICKTKKFKNILFEVYKENCIEFSYTVENLRRDPDIVIIEDICMCQGICNNVRFNSLDLILMNKDASKKDVVTSIKNLLKCKCKNMVTSSNICNIMYVGSQTKINVNISTNNIQEGVEKFKEFLPSIVIVDYEMQDSFMTLLHKTASKYYTPFIIAYGKNVNTELAIKRGATEFADDTDLLMKLDKLIEYSMLKSSEKALVVFSDTLTYYMLCFELSNQGFKFIEKDEGSSYIDMIIEHKPTLVLMYKENILLAEAIRLNENMQNIAIVMLLDSIDNYIISKGNSIGVLGYFSKPFNAEFIVLTMFQVIKHLYYVSKRDSDALVATITSLLNTLEIKDVITYGHTNRVQHMTEELTTYMGFSRDFVKRVSLAASLHDLGKIGVRDNILNKPDKLNSEEFCVIQNHPNRGADIIQNIHTLRDIVPYVRHHHERWDGKGYPDGLKEKEIPLGARLIAVTDTFDAITQDRPYRKGQPIDIALKILAENSGTQFCPECVLKFVELKGGNISELFKGIAVTS